MTTKALMQAPAPACTTQTAHVAPSFYGAYGRRAERGDERPASRRGTVQRRLASGSSADPFEAEAHRAADELDSHGSRRIGVHGRMRSADSGVHAAGTVPASVERALEGSGMALPPRLRHDMERRFGRDFSRVRAHTDATAAQSASDIDADAYTAGRRIVFGPGRFAPETRQGRRLIAHELAHVVQQSAFGEAADESARVAPILRQARGSAQAPSQGTSRPLEIEVVGADAKVDEPLAVMANRWAQNHSGIVLRVSSVSNLIAQLEKVVDSNHCIGNLVVWYHGSPELQLLVGEYKLPPHGQRMPASSFSREWLQLERNRPELNRFRHLFCCDGRMQWIGCGTAMVRAPGGLRTPDEMEREPALFQEHPDLYPSAGDAIRHGSKLAGGSFGHMNVQAWADATCTTIRSATNLVTLRPESKDPITIDDHGHWTDVRPTHACPCDAASGRVGGDAPSREELVKGWQRETAAIVGSDSVLWHEMVSALRTGLPRSTEVIGAGTQGERTFEAQPGTLPDALLKEMKTRKGKRGPLEDYYSTKLLFPLLKMAGAGITPPAPLPNVPMPDHLFVRIAVGGNWAAVTQPHLAVANRDDFWHWSVYNDQAIGETPEFTRTVIQHELEHAADYERDLREFEATHPRPTEPMPRKYGLPAEGSEVEKFDGPWGVYINDFIKFQKTRIKPERHLDIVVGQRSQPTAKGGVAWDAWSAAERAYWFELAFRNLPPDVPAGTLIASEAEVAAAYKQADPALRQAAVERAFNAVTGALCPGKGEDPDEVLRRRSNARTLVQHFDDIVNDMLKDRMRGDMTRGGLLRMLRRPPGESGGMECNL